LSLSLPGRAQVMNVLAAHSRWRRPTASTSSAIEKTLAASQPVPRRGSCRVLGQAA
jgi:hypothetical protein